MRMRDKIALLEKIVRDKNKIIEKYDKAIWRIQGAVDRTPRVSPFDEVIGAEVCMSEINLEGLVAMVKNLPLFIKEPA